MKSNPFHNLFVAAMSILLVSVISCNKPPVGKVVHELPFNDYLWYHKLVNLQDDLEFGETSFDIPQVIGYSFTTPIPGIVDELGVMFPDSGKVYTVSLWDAVTKQLMISKDVEVTNPKEFNYVDLNATNEDQVILANHPYMVGVCTAYIGKSLLPTSFDEYYLSKPSGSIFPFTGYYQHVVNYNQEYLVNIAPGDSYSKYPIGKEPSLNDVDGFCDIEFTYIKF